MLDILLHTSLEICIHLQYIKCIYHFEGVILISFLQLYFDFFFADLARTYDEIDTGSTACFSSGWRRIIREKCKKQEGGCISLFPFGLATYKMQKNVWSNTSNKVVSDLYNAADSRLKLLNADHHDFNFFSGQPTCA